MSKLTEAEIERLTLLIEECSEVIQAATKILRHGYDSYHPTGRYDNRTELERELGDVRWVVEYMLKKDDVRDQAIDDFRDEKQQRVGRYLHHNTP